MTSQRRLAGWGAHHGAAGCKILVLFKTPHLANWHANSPARMASFNSQFPVLSPVVVRRATAIEAFHSPDEHNRSS